MAEQVRCVCAASLALLKEDFICLVPRPTAGEGLLCAELGLCVLGRFQPPALPVETQWVCR